MMTSEKGRGLFYPIKARGDTGDERENVIISGCSFLRGNIRKMTREGTRWERGIQKMGRGPSLDGEAERKGA